MSAIGQKTTQSPHWIDALANMRVMKPFNEAITFTQSR